MGQTDRNMWILDLLRSCFQRSVTVSFLNTDYIYDGKQHAIPFKVEGLPTGCRLEIHDQPVVKDATEDPITVSASQFSVFSPSNADVSRRYSVTVVPAQIRVRKRPLTIISQSASKTWDGTPLTCPECHISGLADGETVVVTALGSISEVGTASNRIAINWRKSSATKGNYHLRVRLGLLTVDPLPIPVENRLSKIQYDGKPHLPNLVVPTGAQVHFECKSPCVDAGEYEVPYSVSLPNHIETRGVAKLLIAPADLSIFSTSSTKVFDGEALSDPAVRIEGLAEDDTLHACAVGSISEVGETENHIAIDWSSSKAKPHNYRLHLHPGTLVITPASMNINSFHTECVYDAKPHSFSVGIPDNATVSFEGPTSFTSVGDYESPFTVEMPNHIPYTGVARLSIRDYSGPITVSIPHGTYVYDGAEHHAEVNVQALPEGYVLVEARSSATAREVSQGVQIATCDHLRIENSEGEDVTSRLNIIYNDGSVQITPRALTVFTYGAKRIYNGKDLRAPGKLMGLCPGETATLTCTGKQRDVGSSVNCYDLVFDGTAREENYTVDENLGTLVVLPAKESVSKPQTQTADSDKPSPVLSGDNAPGTREHTKASESERWVTPVAPSIAPTPSKAPSVRRAFKARPVDRRLNVEEYGLGRSFHPFELEDPSLNDRSLRNDLFSLETQARDAIDILIDRNPRSLLFECFDTFETDDDTIFVTFRTLFEYYHHDKRYALTWIDKHCRNAFLFYFALLARNNYDGDSLWGRMFTNMGLMKVDVQNAAKRMFVAYVYQRGLAIFERNETHTYMLDTAVLHGGLSQASWRDLWEHSLLPLAKSGRLPKDATGGQVLQHILNNASVAPRRRATKNILAMAPDSALANLFASAWPVALRVSQREDDNTIAFIESSGLPSVAIRGLQEAQQSPTAFRSRSGKRAGLLIGRPFDLCLDIAAGCAHLSWDAETTSLDMPNTRMDLLVNGKLLKSLAYRPVVGGFSIQSGSLTLAPCPQYTIERRIMRGVSNDSGNTEWREIASLRQTFSSNKPRCFEFYQDSRGTFRIRPQNMRLTKTRRIAYLIDADMRIEGKHGMRLIGITRGDGDWSDMAIYQFDVAPGAAGLISDAATGENITGWHEDYRVKVGKKHAIGIANDIDLFGHVLGSGETDVALPAIRIEADGHEAAKDVEVRFLRDRQKGTLDASWSMDPSTNTATLHLSFPTTEDGRGIARKCIIEARQRSTKDILLKYQFAIVPIQGFRLEDYKTAPDTHELIGIYQFEATETISLSYRDTGEDEELGVGTPSFIEAPLSQESIEVKMTDTRGAKLTASLFLAGVSITLPERLQRRAEQTSYIGLPSAKTLPFTAGDIRIDAMGARNGRHISLSLGDTVIAGKTLEKPGNITANIFGNPSLFEPAASAIYQSMPLTVAVSYGYRYVNGSYEHATARYSLIDCGRGLEFISCRVSVAQGKHVLCLAGAPERSVPPCRLKVTFLNFRERILDSVIVKQNERHIALPDDVESSYSRNQPIIVRFEMLKRLGNQTDRSSRLDLIMQRGRPVERKRNA